MSFVQALCSSVCGSFGMLLLAGTALAPADIIAGSIGTSSVEPSSGDRSAVGGGDECVVEQICIDRYLWSLYERTRRIDTIKVPEQIKVSVKRWRREPLEVDSYFASYAHCVAVPFGIYDVTQNAGYVTVGISGNTAEFAVNCLEDWWQRRGRSAYPRAGRVLILADGGGGNGYNLRT